MEGEDFNKLNENIENYRNYLDWLKNATFEKHIEQFKIIEKNVDDLEKTYTVIYRLVLVLIILTPIVLNVYNFFVYKFFD